MTVWKYEIPIRHDATVRMQRGAQLLHVAQIGGRLFVWAVVSARAGQVDRRLAVYGTGHVLPDKPGGYFGTAVEQGSALVWHVWDHGERPL